MKKMQGPAPPGKREEPQRSFGRRATAPRQEESERPLPFSNGNSCAGQKEPHSGLLADEFENGPTHIYEHGPDPSGYFARVAITLVGAPDHDGRRSRLVRDLLWGRKGRPPDVDVEDQDQDMDLAA